MGQVSRGDHYATTEGTRVRDLTMHTRVDPLAEWLKALAEPNRLRIFDLLMQGEQCNCDMSSKLNMAANLISHHLRVLEKAGLIVARRDPHDARWVHFAVDARTLGALNSALAGFLDPARIDPHSQQTSCARITVPIATREMETLER